MKLSNEIELLDEKSHSLKEYDEIFKMFSLGHYLHFKKFSDSSSFQNAKDDVLSCLEKGIKALWQVLTLALNLQKIIKK